MRRFNRYSSRQKVELRGVVARPALLVDQADVAAGAERPPARAGDDDARDPLDRARRRRAPPRSPRTMSSVKALSALGRLRRMKPAAPRRSKRAPASSGARFGADGCKLIPAARGWRRWRGDLGDARHAVDVMQRALAGVVGRHRRRVAQIGGQARLENLGIVVLAHRLSRRLGLRGAFDDARDELLGVRLQFDRRVDLEALAREHRVERAGLGERARKAVEDEAFLRVGLADAVFDDALRRSRRRPARPIPSPPWPSGRSASPRRPPRASMSPVDN